MEAWKEKEIRKLLRLKFSDPKRIASPLAGRLLELLNEQLAEIEAVQGKGLYVISR